MTLQSKQAEFVSACIEKYKIKHQLSGKETANKFEKYGVLEFLLDGYDILHTQSISYAISEIEVFLKNRGYQP